MHSAIVRKAFLAIMLAALGFAQTWPVLAQGYPSKPIRLVVPFPAGGPTDNLARSLGQVLNDSMGVPVLVDNRSGAGGNIALEAVVRAQPDGHTLMVLPVSVAAINPSLFKTMKIDPATELEPVAFLASIPNALVVHPSVPARNISELVVLLKGGDKHNFGANGAGTTTRVGWAMFEKLAGVKIPHILYRGDAPMMIDLVANTVQISMPTVFGATPFVKAGTLRALAVTGLERSPTLPDVPTVAESGYPGYEAITWFGIAAPVGTAAPVVQRLNLEINKALQAPAIQQRLRDLGATPRAMSPAEFRSFMHAERKKWGDIVQSEGIVPE